MPDGHQGRWRAGLGIFLGGCLLGSGCHTTPLTTVCLADAPTVRLTSAESRPDPATVRIEPATVLRWKATSAKDAKNPGAQGESSVRSDGTLDLGPYGVVPVGGLTLKQASDTLARHLSKYIPDARVHVSAYVHTAPAPGGPAAVARKPEPAGREQERQAGTLSPAAYQPQASAQSVRTAAVPVNPSPADALITGAPPEEPPAGKPAPGDVKRGESNAPPLAEQAAVWPLPPGVPDLPSLHGSPGGGPGFAPNELSKVSLPPYRVEPPDILLVEYVAPAVGIFLNYEVRGQHLVRPDGTINLGAFGPVSVAGMTLEQAKVAILARLQDFVNAEQKGNDRAELDPRRLNVDVLAYNSKVYYVITDGAGYGAQIYRLPIYGSETVLDALAQVGGLPPVSSKKRVWVARRVPDGGPPKILPVDYVGTTQCGLAGTNFQLMPGDRVFVGADPLRTLDTNVAKILSPIERVFGFTLLGAETVTAVKSASRSGGTTTTP